MKFAKIVFWIAGIWGVLILTPLYFMFNLIGRKIRRPSLTRRSSTDSSEPAWPGNSRFSSSPPTRSAIGR